MNVWTAIIATTATIARIAKTLRTANSATTAQGATTASVAPANADHNTKFSTNNTQKMTTFA